jgi:hypothetical protein
MFESKPFDGDSRVAPYAALLSLLLLVPCRTAIAQDSVGVDGSRTKYPTSIQVTIADKPVTLSLTGASQRKKAWFKVYTIGSYIDPAAGVTSAAQLAQKDCAKKMHLVMERNVDGKTMGEAFNEGIELNYPGSKFADEKRQLLEFMKGKDLRTGDQVWLTHIPGAGFLCELPGNQQVMIKSVPFAVAIWEIYLGEKNIGDAIKAALTSRLGS